MAASLAVPAFAQDSTETQDSTTLPQIDAIVQFDSVAQVDSVAKDSAIAPDPVAPPQEAVGEVNQDSPDLKSVLYLGGGDRSPWFYLGVLYALEEYGVPVDSIVGTSWGAWVGALWSRGVPVDEIQRLMLDPAIVSYVGKDLTLEKMSSKEGQEMAVSPKGIASLRQRFTLQVDSAGHVKRHLRPLEMDSVQLRHSLARLRFQESLYRQRGKQMIPFAVQGCEGPLEGNSVEAVINSLPLWEPREISGEICPHFAMPAEDQANEVSLIAVADPLRSEFKGDDRKLALLKQAAATLATQPGVIIRSHSVQDTSRNAWIQAGFSAVERKLPEMDRLAKRRVDYSQRNRSAALPWFKFNPSFDGVSSELHTSVKSRWTEADTGLTAPLNFAWSLAENPAYDSLRMEMLPNGDLSVGTAVHPTFDLAAGGFGSNVIGANGYLEATINFVDQMEIQLALRGFWGSSSYGFQPRLDISRLWNRHWSVQFGYDLLTLRPLDRFNNDITPSLRIYSEERNDFTMSVAYRIDNEQTASLDFLFGKRTFELDKYLYGKDPIKTYPVSPALHYSYLRGDENKWFSTEGLALDAAVALESIGFDFGVNDVIPIYWKFTLDARYTISPKPFATFTVGASGGIERYHEDGYGYVNPESFGYAPLDQVYRLHGEATPWSSQWNDLELCSHEYGLLRAGASLHKGYFGLWLFGAFFHDFEDNPYATLSPNKIILEPALRFSYKSISVYAGMNRIVDKDHLGDLKRLKEYTYFIRVGEYQF